MENSPGPSSSKSSKSNKRSESVDSAFKKKRTRRKPRKKENELNGGSVQQNGFFLSPNSKKQKCSEQPKLNFSIEPVQQVPGTFYRQRNENFAPINLYSYIQSTRQIPIQFITHSCIPNDIINRMVNLAVENGIPPSSRSKKRHPKQRIETFSEYISLEEAEKGLQSGAFSKGCIRINPKKVSEAYVGNKDTSQIDYIITTALDRNRALEGDEVVLMPKRTTDEQLSNSDRKIMQVVHILKKVHPRVVIGFLSTYNQEWAMVTPRDKRCPKVLVPRISWPNGFQTDPKNYSNILFMCKILNWDDVRFAKGAIVENLGQMGNLKVESLAILREFCLDITPFNSTIREFLPATSEIPKIELTCREDLRKDCVFTIDPITARDLDDAVSCNRLDNGNFEVGVHISDASFYLQENTKLDELVREKATTIYMVDSVYHMLPVELCLFCSLLPGADKLTFSVIWEMTPDGEVVNKRITRTIINSCAQLAYEHAQAMIDNAEEKKGEETPPLPQIHNGYTASDLSRVVNDLQKLAVCLRKQREANGSLKINQVKIAFSLDPVSGFPEKLWVCDNKPAHRLIEEFMLLANQTVAKHIEEAYPELAFLRLHEPPKPTMINELQKSLEKIGIFIDCSSAGAIQASLDKYSPSSSDDFLGNCRMAVLNHLFAKPMQRARYFCAGRIQEDLTFKHYALSIPIYTHFTSPIRRYADIMVHRLLAASLKYREKPEWDADEVAEIAETCNRQKYNAKRAGEASCELYLAHYVEANKSLVEDAVVVDVKENCVDAIVLKTGTVVRVYNNRVDDNGKWKAEEVNIDSNDEKDVGKRTYKVIVEFPPSRLAAEKSQITLDIFTVIRVELTRKPKSNKLESKLLRPRAL